MGRREDCGGEWSSRIEALPCYAPFMQPVGTGHHWGQLKSRLPSRLLVGKNPKGLFFLAENRKRAAKCVPPLGLLDWPSQAITL